jgi:hypothetical protein
MLTTRLCPLCACCSPCSTIGKTHDNPRGRRDRSRSEIVAGVCKLIADVHRLVWKKTQMLLQPFNADFLVADLDPVGTQRTDPQMRGWW